MLKPSKTFKLSKSTKTALASIIDPHKRGEWKRAMIDAQLASEIVPKVVKKEQRPGGNYVTTSTSATAAE